MARPSVAKTPFSQRLTAVREALGCSERKAFAAELGMNAETLGGYERGDTFPDQAFLLRYKQDFSVNIDWLITGEGEMFPAGKDQLGSDLIALPFYADVAASAGPGLVVGPEAHESVVAFTRTFLRDQGATPESCSVIRARGDSMAPTIPDASLLIVDHAQAEVANGCIMVINVGEDLLVKRVRRRLDGLVDLVSDNPAYPPETIGRETIQQLRIVGRVVYFCRIP